MIQPLQRQREFGKFYNINKIQEKVKKIENLNSKEIFFTKET